MEQTPMQIIYLIAENSKRALPSQILDLLKSLNGKTNYINGLAELYKEFDLQAGSGEEKSFIKYVLDNKILDQEAFDVQALKTNFQNLGLLDSTERQIVNSVPENKQDIIKKAMHDPTFREVCIDGHTANNFASLQITGLANNDIVELAKQPIYQLLMPYFDVKDCLENIPVDQQDLYVARFILEFSSDELLITNDTVCGEAKERTQLSAYFRKNYDRFQQEFHNKYFRKNEFGKEICTLEGGDARNALTQIIKEDPFINSLYPNHDDKEMSIDGISRFKSVYDTVVNLAKNTYNKLMTDTNALWTLDMTRNSLSQSVLLLNIDKSVEFFISIPVENYKLIDYTALIFANSNLSKTFTDAVTKRRNDIINSALPPEHAEKFRQYVQSQTLVSSMIRHVNSKENTQTIFNLVEHGLKDPKKITKADLEYTHKLISEGKCKTNDIVKFFNEGGKNLIDISKENITEIFDFVNSLPPKNKEKIQSETNKCYQALLTKICDVGLSTKEIIQSTESAMKLAYSLAQNGLNSITKNDIIQLCHLDANSLSEDQNNKINQVLDFFQSFGLSYGDKIKITNALLKRINDLKSEPTLIDKFIHTSEINDERRTFVIKSMSFLAKRNLALIFGDDLQYKIDSHSQYYLGSSKLSDVLISALSGYHWLDMLSEGSSQLLPPRAANNELNNKISENFLSNHIDSIPYLEKPDRDKLTNFMSTFFTSQQINVTENPILENHFMRALTTLVETKSLLTKLNKDYIAIKDFASNPTNKIKDYTSIQLNKNFEDVFLNITVDSFIFYLIQTDQKEFDVLYHNFSNLLLALEKDKSGSAEKTKVQDVKNIIDKIRQTTRKLNYTTNTSTAMYPSGKNLYDKITAYGDNKIIEKIIAGRQPSAKIFQDDDTGKLYSKLIVQKLGPEKAVKFADEKLEHQWPLYQLILNEVDRVQISNSLNDQDPCTLFKNILNPNNFISCLIQASDKDASTLYDKFLNAKDIISKIPEKILTTSLQELKTKLEYIESKIIEYRKTHKDFDNKLLNIEKASQEKQPTIEFEK